MPLHPGGRSGAAVSGIPALPRYCQGPQRRLCTSAAGLRRAHRRCVGPAHPAAAAERGGPQAGMGHPCAALRLRRLLAGDSGGLRQPLRQPVSRQGRRARVFSGTCPQPLGAGQCVQCKATAVHRLDAAHPARAGVRSGAVHRQGHLAGSWRSTTRPRRQSPPASGLAWYRIQPATFDAPPGRSLGCTRPSLTGTLSKSKGLMPSMQATLMPYWSGEERRWWKV